MLLELLLPRSESLLELHNSCISYGIYGTNGCFLKYRRGKKERWISNRFLIDTWFIILISIIKVHLYWILNVLCYSNTSMHKERLGCIIVMLLGIQSNFNNLCEADWNNICICILVRQLFWLVRGSLIYNWAWKDCTQIYFMVCETYLKLSLEPWWCSS